MSECTYIHSLTLASGIDVRLLRKPGGKGIAQLRGTEEQEAAGSDRRQEGILQLDRLSPIHRHRGAATDLLTLTE